MSLPAPSAPQRIRGGARWRGGLAGLALLALPTAADAVILTIVKQSIIDGGLTASNSDNPSPTWVVGGAGSGIDYGTTQRPAIFTSAIGPAGTGNFNSFLGLSDQNNNNQDPGPPQPNTEEQGHNNSLSNGQSIQPESENGTHTNDITVTDFGIVTIGNGGSWIDPNGVPQNLNDPDIVAGSYLSMAYDINPINSYAQPHVTILEFQVWLSPTAITAEYPLGPADPGFNLGTKIWDLDANGTDNSITVHDNNNGSGSYDMAMYFRVGDFLEQVPSATGAYYVYVWMKTEMYGETNHNDLGSLRGAPDAYYPPPNDPIPEPGQYSLIGVGLLLLSLRRRRKREAA